MASTPLAESDLLVALRKYANAEEKALEAIAADPESAEGYQYLAFALCAQSRWEEAEGALNTALSKNPADPWNHAARSYIAEERGQLAQAVVAARETLALAPEWNDAYARLARTLHAAGKPSDGYAVASEGLTKFPDDHALLSIQGFAAHQLGRLDEVQVIAAKGRSLFPDSPHFHALAGLVIMTRAARLRPGTERRQLHWEAERSFAEAVRLAPTESYWQECRKNNAVLSRLPLIRVAFYAVVVLVLLGSVYLPRLVGRTDVNPIWQIGLAILFVGLWRVRLYNAKPLALVAPLVWARVVNLPLTKKDRLAGRLQWVLTITEALLTVLLPLLLC